MTPLRKMFTPGCAGWLVNFSLRKASFISSSPRRPKCLTSTPNSFRFPQTAIRNPHSEFAQMLSERSKIGYAKSVLRRQYTGASTTTGVLVSGKFYRITHFVSGDDFRNVGAPVPTRRCGSGYHTTGQIFEATGTTPTVWTHASKLTEIKVAELRAYAAAVFAAAKDPVTLTSGSFEGGQGSGIVTFEKTNEGIAIEQLLQEMDPDYVHTQIFPRRSMGVTVRL